MIGTWRRMGGLAWERSQVPNPAALAASLCGNVDESCRRAVRDRDLSSC